MQTNVTFPSNGLAISGTLFTPDGADQPLPAVVVGHPGGGVKEQTASLYAQRLARNGFAALVFDAAYQGESEGEPRGLENPFQRAEDVKAAVSYLTTRADVDRIGALGICASGGYVSFAAQTDLRIEAVATVSATDTGTAFREGIDGEVGPEALRAALAQAGAARTAEARGDEVPRTDWVSHEVPAQDAPEPEREVFDYYRTPRGHHPRAVLPFPVRSLDHLVQFDAFAHADLLAPRPVLMIAGSEAFTARFSRETVERVGSSARLVVVDGAGHYDLYDKDEFVTPAVAELVPFVAENLRR